MHYYRFSNSANLSVLNHFLTKSYGAAANFFNEGAYLRYRAKENLFLDRKSVV
jgi:hypothetical protein